jgi:hypothetical protein
MRADNVAGQFGIVLGLPLSGVTFYAKVLALNVSKAVQLLKKTRKTRRPWMVMSPTLSAGLTIAMRFIFADCCATAPRIVGASIRPAMNSRRLINRTPWTKCRANVEGGTILPGPVVVVGG